MAQELFDLGDGMAVCSNPGGRFHGWLFRKHPDGEFVSVRKLVDVSPFSTGLDRKQQLDTYGLALMMIREGCEDARGLAAKTLDEFALPQDKGGE